MPEGVIERAKILAMIQDICGELAEEQHAKDGRLCQECPVLVEIVNKMRLALVMETEKLADAGRKDYGF